MKPISFPQNPHLVRAQMVDEMQAKTEVSLDGNGEPFMRIHTPAPRAKLHRGRCHEVILLANLARGNSGLVLLEIRT